MTRQHFDLVIVGTGSGNSILGSEFAGWQVAIVEHGVFGGTCLNVGCIPTKMFVHTADLAGTPAHASPLGVDETLDQVRWSDIRDRIFGRIDPIAAGGREYRMAHPDNANVTVFEATGRFTGHKRLRLQPTDGGTEREITGEKFVLAAGSRALAPDIDGLGDVGYHTSDTVMRLDELPPRMAILGSGFIAAEFAHVFSALGVQVTQIARSGVLLRAEDEALRARFTECAESQWTVRRNTEPSKVERTSAGVRLHFTADGPLDTDALLVAVGRRPNGDLLDVAATGVPTSADGYVIVDDYQRTEVDGIYALGDVSSPYELKHVANLEARVVKHNLAHPEAPQQADHRFVPHAVFTSPQIASVGLTEQQARAEGREYVTAVQEYAGIAYGWAMEDRSGFAKLLADSHTGLLLGAHIIGPQAATLIQPLIQAMSFGLGAREMARGQYWIHPAMPELIENALLNLDLS
jgi:mycothione reductase